MMLNMPLTWNRAQKIEPLIKPFPWNMVRFAVGFSVTAASVTGYLVWWFR